MFRKGDSKGWVKLYNSLFIALNEKKQVLTWHFTQTEKFDFVKDVLEKLKERKHVNLHMFLLDNCCKWEKKIKELCGQEILIKLDPFHAIQRITSTIRKKHPFHKQLCNDLKNLFKVSTDFSSQIRTKDTASEMVILSRLDSIVKKWESLEYLLEGRSLITSETREAIDNLRKHIIKGCLSNIPPGCSTSANENLHRYLNKFISGQIMGPELAEALFSIFFYNWNLQIASEKVTHQNLGNEKFGFGGSSKQNLPSINTNINVGKWTNSMSSDGPHHLIKKITTYRMLKSVYDFKYLVDIVSNPRLPKIILSLVGNEDIHVNAKNFGYSVMQPGETILKVISHQLSSLVKVSKYTAVNKHLKSLGIFSSEVDTISQVLSRSCEEKDISSLADLLSITVIVFTCSSDIPVIPIYPKRCLSSQLWLFVGYENGQFFSCVELEQGTPASKRRKLSCSCGKSSKDPNKVSCVDVFSYKSRCPCLGSKTGCKDCNCKNCKNPYGVQVNTKVKHVRKRDPPQIETKRLSSEDFLHNVGETARKGAWSDVETLLLYDLLNNIEDTDLPTLLRMFNSNAVELQNLFFQIDLKSIKELQCKVKNCSSSREWFKSILSLIS